jgi:putative peptide zinc metalloprotease protein
MTTIGRHPRLADGVELLGEFRDSGFSDPPSLVRRGDGQVLQLPRVLYLVAESLDGRRSPEDIAERVSVAAGQGIDADGIRFLVDEKLAPVGLVADAGPRRLARADPMLALRLRAAVVPARAVQVAARVLSPLFLPTVVVGVLAGVIALDVWAFAFHGLAQALRDVLADPLLVFVLLALVIVSAGFHECGHAAACDYGGARPGAMGVGLYLVWPAFYTDVTESYRLGRRDRLRTDLGGVYFNCIVILACGLGYLATGFAPLLLFVPLQHMEILHQLMPVLRLDGYLIVSDLTGVPDILARIRPTLLSLVPGRPPEEAVRGLRRRARVAVTAYVLTVVPLLLAALGLMLVSVPRILGTAERSFTGQLHLAELAFGGGDPALGLLACLQLTVLVLPAAGVVYGLGRSGRRLAVATMRSGPRQRAAMLVAAAAGAVVLGFAWWPAGAYQPVERSDAGTLQHGFHALGRLLSSGSLSTDSNPPAPPAAGGPGIAPDAATPAAPTSERTTVGAGPPAQPLPARPTTAKHGGARKPPAAGPPLHQQPTTTTTTTTGATTTTATDTTSTTPSDTSTTPTDTSTIPATTPTDTTTTAPSETTTTTSTTTTPTTTTPTTTTPTTTTSP